MSARRDPDRLVHDFLMEGQTELADPVLDAVRATIEQKRQRVVVGPWRLPPMNKLVPIGLGAAAVVLVVVGGTQLLRPAPSGIGAAPSATPAPTATPTPTAAPSVAAASPSDGSLPEGSFVFASTTSPVPGGLAATVAIAAPGWHGEPTAGILTKGGEMDFAGLIGPWHEPLFVYGDPCHWSTTTPKKPATTVDKVVAALTTQKERNRGVPVPVDVTLDGYAGKKVTLHVPADYTVASEGKFVVCDQEKFASWGSSSEPGIPARYQQFPGQIDEVWVVDIDGQAAVIDGMYFPETPAETVAELRAIINSIDFQP